MKWKNITEWSQRDSTETRKTPRTWQMELPHHLRVVVTRHIHCEPTDWMVCVLHAEKVLKGNLTADEAKVYAEDMLRKMLADVTKALEGGR